MNVPPRLVLVMGVSGSGKSTLARALATRLDWRFLDGDDVHPARNVALMQAGVPLSDADRAPWLSAIAAWMIDRAAGGGGAIVACSALKRRYRDRLREAAPDLRLVYLCGDGEIVAERLAGRAGHFMPPRLLDSQFADLEEPLPDENALWVPVAQPVAEQVRQAVEGLSAE